MVVEGPSRLVYVCMFVCWLVGLFDVCEMSGCGGEGEQWKGRLRSCFH